LMSINWAAPCEPGCISRIGLWPRPGRKRRHPDRVSGRGPRRVLPDGGIRTVVISCGPPVAPAGWAGSDAQVSGRNSSVHDAHRDLHRRLPRASCAYVFMSTLQNRCRHGRELICIRMRDFPVMAVTSHDVARLAGVSQPTVSRALRDQAGVSASTRRRVREAARALGYVPIHAGRALPQAPAGSGSSARSSAILPGAAGPCTPRWPAGYRAV
jgi:hypothetical protein